MAVWNTEKIGWSSSLRTAHKSASKGNYEDAIKYYKEALEEGNNEILILNNLADTYVNAGQPGSGLSYAEKAVDRAGSLVVPYVTLAEIYQAKGDHQKAVEYILKAGEIFEETVPELKGMAFDSIEEVIKKLPAKVKLDIASKNWIRIIYLVKSMISNFEQERKYTKAGVTWEFLLDIRRKSLNSFAQKYLWSKEKIGIKGDAAAAIANTYGAVSSIIGSPKVKVVEKTSTSSSINIPTCWQYSVIRSMGLDKELGWIKCSCMCSEQINAVAQIINPVITFEFNSTLPDNNKYCKGVFKTGR